MNYQRTASWRHLRRYTIYVVINASDSHSEVLGSILGRARHAYYQPNRPSFGSSLIGTLQHHYFADISTPVKIYLFFMNQAGFIE